MTCPMLALRSLTLSSFAFIVVACSTSSQPPPSPPLSFETACTRIAALGDGTWASILDVMRGAREVVRPVPDAHMAPLSPEDREIIVEAKAGACVHEALLSGSHVTAEWLDACRTAIVTGENLEACNLPRGKLDVGESCESHRQCVSLRCGTMDVPNRCAEALHLGEGCSPWFDPVRLTELHTTCGADLMCAEQGICARYVGCTEDAYKSSCVEAPAYHYALPAGEKGGKCPCGASLICNGAVCVSRLGLNERCGSDECEEGLYCGELTAGDSGYAPGVYVCKQRQAIGESCSDTEKCAVGAYCKCEDSSPCMDRMGTCAASLPLGSPCPKRTSKMCGDPLNVQCTESCDSAGFRCQRETSESEPSLLAPGAIGHGDCAYGYKHSPCDPCPKLIGHGEACTVNDTCPDQMFCREGYCKFYWE